jgi:2-oxoisovalerate dehydrogenase E1 component
MINRFEILDQNFINFLSVDFTLTDLNLARAQEVKKLLTNEQWIQIFESQMQSRLLDIKARHLKKDNHSFYTIGSSGHEGNAAIAHALRVTDPALLHYRSAGFMIERSKQIPGMSILYDTLLSFMAKAEDPISGGRHKVLGSKPLNIPPQTSTIASHLPKSFGLAFAIARAKLLGFKGEYSQDAVVFCNFGDASFNHASAQTAINASDWTAFQNLALPLIWCCEDNGIGISVPTPRGWIEHAIKARPSLELFACDGSNLFDVFAQTQAAAKIAREKKRPVFLLMKTVRLLGHAGSDIETSYLELKTIEAQEARDPLLYSASYFQELSILSKKEMLELYLENRERIDRIALEIIPRKVLSHADEVKASLLPPRKEMLPDHGKILAAENIWGQEVLQMARPQTLGKLINWVLFETLAKFPEVVLFGEDVAKKGGVYNVTANLEKKFGKARVFNSLLDETTILGTAIGLSQNGFLPIPEIQFLAYLHNAEDQLRGEAATQSFFSHGQYTNPMIVRIASLAYQKGFGGHFHNDNSWAVLRDIPGLIIACPADGVSAVKMFRTLVHEARVNQRVCVFLEPIALYATRDLHQKGDGLYTGLYPAIAEKLELGDFNLYEQPSDTLIITYGNGTFLALQAQQKITCTILDLCWLAPINEKGILAVAKKYKKILVVDECRKTGSLSEALMTLLVEHGHHDIVRICSEDTFIPLGTAADCVLVSVEQILEKLK